MKAKRILLFLLVIGLLAGGYVYFFVWNKSHPDYVEMEADFSLPANELYQSFANDAQSSSTKYNGKMIELSGEVHELEMADSLVIAVFVFNEGMFGNEGIRCTFINNEINDISQLKGKNIKGYCTGFNDTDVILEKCTLTQP